MANDSNTCECDKIAAGAERTLFCVLRMAADVRMLTAK